MKKKLSPQSVIQKSLEPKLLSITSVRPEIVATLNEAPFEFMTRMKLKETLDRNQRHERNRTREQNQRSMNGQQTDGDVNQLSDDSDLAVSPAAESIHSSYQSPIFQELAEVNPCPVDGCPLNPSVRSRSTFIGNNSDHRNKILALTCELVFSKSLV